jgi:acyl-CoA synthetase (AMP-forming)/AMP-acid ligase II
MAWLRRFADIPSLWISTQDGLPVGSDIRVCLPRASGASEIVALGPPMPGMRVRVLDDAGSSLPAGCLGHIEIQGPNVTRGYFDGPDREWCATGDLGFVHEGLVYITGRAKDVLFINGRNHFSNDIEAALCKKLQWPANQLAVVGVTHPQRRTEQVVVFFRLERGADRKQQAEQMREALEQVLSYPIAGAIGLSALPKTTSGKIRRFALRARRCSTVSTRQRWATASVPRAGR